MSLVNPDNISLYSPNPALQIFETGTFTISVSGNVGVGGSQTWSGSKTLGQTGSLIRLYVNQNPVPGGFNAPYYNSSQWLAIPSYGSPGGLSPLLTIGCSVAGNPSVSGDAQTVAISISGTSLAASVTENNPYAGVMTMTNTTLIFKYIAYVVTPAFNP